MKKTIRLTKSELKHLIRESVKNIVNEGKWDGDTSVEKTISVNNGTPQGYQINRYDRTTPVRYKYSTDDLQELFDEYRSISNHLRRALIDTMGDDIGDKLSPRMKGVEQMISTIIKSSEVMAPIKTPLQYREPEYKNYTESGLYNHNGFSFPFPLTATLLNQNV